MLIDETPLPPPGGRGEWPGLAGEHAMPLANHLRRVTAMSSPLVRVVLCQATSHRLLTLAYMHR